MNKPFQQKIIEYLEPSANGLSVVDVRIGLGYTSVRLDNGNAGIAWTAQSDSGTCTHLPKAGTLAGSRAVELLEMLAKPNNLSRTVGLAAANALAAGLSRPETTKTDVLELVNIQADDHVAMAGFFGPLIPVIKKTGCKFDIIELNRSKPGTLSPEDGGSSLEKCTVAILTATSIVTGTIDDLLSSLGNPRSAVILGPSTLMRPEVFSDTKVTHLAGSRINDPAGVEKIISEGGGTMLLKKFVDFETVCIKR